MSHSQHSFTCTHKSPSTTHHLPPLRSLDLRTFYKPHGAYASACLQRLEPTGIPVNIYKGSARQSFIQRGLLGNRPFTYLSTSWNIWRGFLAEMRLLSHPRYLRPLQGVCVPFVIGVLRSTRGLVDVVTELPHVTGWRTARPSMPISEKLSILKAYELIHDQGVLHGSVALCNMLVGDVGNITILDYKRAACLDTHAIPDLETCKPHELDFELRKVKFMLDIHGARANEYHLAQYTTHEGRVRPYSRHYLHPGDPFYIREETLRQWEAVAQEEDESSTVYNVPEQYRFSPSGCSIRSTSLPLAPYQDKSLTETEQEYLLQLADAHPSCPPSPHEHGLFSGASSLDYLFQPAPPSPTGHARVSSPVISEDEVSAMISLDNNATPPPQSPVHGPNPMASPSPRSLGKRARTDPSGEDELLGRSISHPKRARLFVDTQGGPWAPGHGDPVERTAEFVRSQRAHFHTDACRTRRAHTRLSQYSPTHYCPPSPPISVSRWSTVRDGKQPASKPWEGVPSLSPGSDHSDTSEDAIETPLDGFPPTGPFAPPGRRCVASNPTAVEYYESDLGHRMNASAASSSSAFHLPDGDSLPFGTAEPSRSLGPRMIVFVNESFQSRAYQVAKDVRVITEAYVRSRPAPRRDAAGKRQQKRR